VLPDPDRKPVYPLLSALAVRAKYNFKDAVLLTDDARKVVDFIANFHATLGVADAPRSQRSDRFKGRAMAAL
jgi:hypothetical protein